MASILSMCLRRKSRRPKLADTFCTSAASFSISLHGAALLTARASLAVQGKNTVGRNTPELACLS